MPLQRTTKKSGSLQVDPAVENCGSFDMCTFAGGYIISSSSGDYSVFNSVNDISFKQVYLNGEAVTISLNSDGHTIIPAELYPLSHIRLVGTAGTIEVILKT